MGFEPTISAGERPKTDALDRAATGIGFVAADCGISIVKREITFENSFLRLQTPGKYVGKRVGGVAEARCCENEWACRRVIVRTVGAQHW